MGNNDNLAITVEEEEAVATLRAVLNDEVAGHEVAIMRAGLNGQPVAVILTISDHPSDPQQNSFTPLAVLVSDQLFDQLDPDFALPEGLEPFTVEPANRESA